MSGAVERVLSEIDAKMDAAKDLAELRSIVERALRVVRADKADDPGDLADALDAWGDDDWDPVER